MKSTTVSSPGYLVGRDEELRRLTALADASADRPVVVFGRWGAGKSTMLRALAESAQARGVRVVQAPAASLPGKASSPARAPYAGLRALLGQLSPAMRLPALPDTVAPQSPQSAGMAAVRLLADAADASAAGVLAIVDDAHQVDEASAQALAVVCRRLRSVRAGLVLASSERTLPADLEVPAHEVVLGPLSDHDAHLLLERRTALGRGWLRRTVVAQARGNPLALLDYARTVTGQRPPGANVRPGLGDGSPGVPAHWPADRPLPCSPAMRRRLAAVLRPLPAGARLALLIAASASGEELAQVIAADPRGLTPGAWRAAEEAGLVATSAHGVEFTSPLICSAVYHLASQDERAVVHRGIAQSLAAWPERRAWHLAEALPPARRDPELAEQLERWADDSARRQGPEAAATALARAATLTGDDEDTARRLTKAAAQAALSGDTTWAQPLAAQAAALTRDPARRTAAVLLAASSLVWAGQYEQALPLLLPLAAALPPLDPAVAAAALSAAAMAAYSLGEARYRGAVHDAASQAGAGDGASTETGTGTGRAFSSMAGLFSLVVCAPFQDREQRTQRLREQVSASPRSGPQSGTTADPRLAGTAAWLLDESELAVETLRHYLDRSTGWTGRGQGGGPAIALAGACLDTGRWSRAGQLAERVAATELLDQAGFALVAAQTTLAFLAAHRGDAAEAARLAAAAERSAQPWSDRAALAKAKHAAGLAALYAGDDEAAYETLRELLSGRAQGPLHYHCSYYAVADFAVAAARTGRQAHGSRILTAALRRLDGSPSPRIELLIQHAQALLSSREDQPERHFRAALAPGSGQWPVEQARTLLHYAEWLRRRHRENEAIPLLVSARRSFELVGAQPAIARVDEELRAARRSRTVPDGTESARAAVSLAWSRMSAHQQNVLRLAAWGRSNREIAAELFLSPRTVGSHLYRAFPSLGISSRQQIREVLTGAGIPL